MSSTSDAAASRTVLRGVAVSHGVVEGTVRVVASPAAFRTFKKNEILVTPFLTPEYASVVHKAKGVIADVGAIMSHAAVVVRELGIPCLVGTKEAAKILRNGDAVRLDTKRGIVEVVSHGIHETI